MDIIIFYDPHNTSTPIEHILWCDVDFQCAHVISRSSLRTYLPKNTSGSNKSALPTNHVEKCNSGRFVWFSSSDVDFFSACVILLCASKCCSKIEWALKIKRRVFTHPLTIAPFAVCRVLFIIQQAACTSNSHKTHFARCIMMLF